MNERVESLLIDLLQAMNSQTAAISQLVESNRLLILAMDDCGDSDSDPSGPVYLSGD